MSALFRDALCIGRVAPGSHFRKHVISPLALSSYRTLMEMPSNWVGSQAMSCGLT